MVSLYFRLNKKDKTGEGFLPWLRKRTKMGPDDKYLRGTVPHLSLHDENGKLLVDAVGRFENLQEDFATICDKMGIERKVLPQTNSSEHKGYAKYYNEESRELVRRLYASDVETFGYDFES